MGAVPDWKRSTVVNFSFSVAMGTAYSESAGPSRPENSRRLLVTSTDVSGGAPLPAPSAWHTPQTTDTSGSKGPDFFIGPSSAPYSIQAGRQRVAHLQSSSA